MDVAIIGAGGFLGRYLTAYHVAKDDHVYSVYHRNKEHLQKKTQIVPVNDLVKIGNNCELVYMLSSFIPYGKMNEPSSELVEVNVKLVERVCEHFVTSKIIFASSVSVYGNHTSTVNEHSSFISPTLYGQSKLAGEFIIQNHPNYAIVRFSSLYGSGMTGNTFIPQIIKRANEEKNITLFGDGSRKQDYLHVRDAVGYLVSAASATDKGICLGVSGLPLTNLQVAEIVKDNIPGTTISFSGKDNSPSFIYNNTETIKKLNFTPSVSPELGIKELINGI